MKGIRLGYSLGRKVIRYKGESHLVLVAPTRSGKGRDVLGPAALEYDGSCIVIDPKGQLAAITRAQRERMGQRVIVLNPFDILPNQLGPSAQFNPMASLDPDSDAFGSDCDNIADSIIVHEQGQGRDNHWSESAHALISGLIAHLCANMRLDESKTLPQLRRIISSPQLLQENARAAQDGDNEFAADGLAPFIDLDAPNKSELASIISTARTQTKFIATRAIARSLSGSDFRFRDLKREPTTVYLTLPTRYLGSCGKWFRLIIASALNDLLREDDKDVPVLMILDEFYQLGRLKIIQNAMGLAAGYGVQLWPVLQDLTQLKENYQESWETFLGNAGIVQYFAPREWTTSEYVSQMCGETTIHTTSRSSGTSKNSGRGFFDDTTGESDGTSTNVAQRRLKLPQEVRQLGDNEFLLFAEGTKNVTTGYRIPYYEIPEFAGLYSPDPYHKLKAKP
jgi:type IV secretion system protein VirD4